MASCVRNIRTKNYQNLIIGIKLQSKMSGMFFLRHSVVCGVVWSQITTMWYHRAHE